MEERSLILHDLPDDFDLVKSKIELYFKNRRRSGGEVLQITEHPDDKRKARLIYGTEEDIKNVLDKKIHKLDFKTHGSVEVTVTLPEDSSNKKMKPVVLPKPKLEKVVKVLQVCPVPNPATTSPKVYNTDNEGDCEISDLLITAPHSVDKEMLQMYCERFTEHFVLQKYGNNSWILKLSSQSDLQNILEQKKHELDISIKVYKEEKLGEKLDPRRFILTGIDGSIECTKISLFIGSCSKTTEHDWEILDEERIVVTFRQDIDVTSFIRKCTSKALQGHEIGVTRLELTDSVLVQGDLEKISEHALKLHFSNTMKSRGGDIKSLIWINRQKSVLITFQQSDIAHEVVEQKHCVWGTEVKASLFYSSLQKALTGEKLTLTDIPTRINITVNENLLYFIENNDQCRTSLESLVRPLYAKVLIDRSVEASAIMLQMDVDKTSLTALQIRPTWKRKTERTVQTFLSKYHTTELNVDKDVWQRVKNDCMHLITGNNVIREFSSKIIIAGVKEEVIVLSEKIKRLLDITAVEVETQRNTIDVIIQLDCREKCELVKEHVQSKLGEVALSYDENRHKFHLKGLRDQVASAKLLIEQANESIIMHRLKLSSHLTHFLLSLNLQKLEQDHFFSNHILAKFSKKKDFVGIFAEKDNLKRVVDKICEIVREERIQLSPNQTDENWTIFLMKLQGEVESSQIACNIRFIQSDAQLVLCGFSDVVAEVEKKVNGYLEHRKPTTEDVPLKSVRDVEFVDSCVNLSELPEIKRLGATIRACRTTACPCLKVTAAKDNIKEAVSVIKKQLLAIVVERHRYRKAGEAKVLDKHEASVKAKAKEFQCNLYLSQEPVNKPDPSQSFTHNISGFITLAITRGDWYCQSAEALICPINGNLVFDNPVAKQFLQFGGDQIIEVCKKHQSKTQTLLPGDVLLGNAGLLNAKSLIYAVMPHKGQPLDSRHLQSAIHNALLKAEEQRCTSILIPALACEIFGFSVRESWTALRDAILQFCADHQNSPKNIKDVYMVHSDKKTVEEYNAVIEQLSFPDTSSNVQLQRQQQETRVLINGVPIYLKKADITKETVDIIVNSNNRNLNLDTGVSGAILKAAGRSVVDECAKQAPLKAGGVVMTSGGDLKCKHIAQMVGPEGPADITSSLGKVLSLCEDKMASTLAIPAIGTGRGQIGLKESIEAILIALKKHLIELNSSCLKEISIVALEQKIMDAYQKYFSKWNKASSRHAQPAYGRMPENQVKIKSVRIEVKKGDITKETVRGIVNSSNREMTLTGGVSGAIFNAAGASVKQECKKNGPLQKDVPAVTSGGNLQCDFIIHMTGPHSASETRSRVKKVLESCEEKQITTVSFPALGTGGGGVKSVDAINAMLKGFEDHLAQNSSTVIKLIYIVIDRDDVLQEFQKGLKAWIANTQNSEENDEDQLKHEHSDYSTDEESTSSNFERDTTDPAEAIIGPMKVKVTCGDITKETAEAIVNSTTTSLDLSTGVSGAILKAAGQTVVNECKTKAPQHNDGVILTKAGNLTNIRHIIHMVGQTDVKGITTSMSKVLKMCEENHIQSVSFPALGTGAGNLAATQVANAMIEALVDFVKDSPQHLQRVQIVIFQSKMLPAFQEAIKKFKKIRSSAKVPTPPTSASGKAQQPQTFRLANQTASVSFPIMAVEIYGMSSSNAAKVKKYLDDLISEECISKNVQSIHLANLPESDQKTIVTLSQSNEVRVLVAGPDRWTVSGKKDDVLDAILKINNSIQEARDREVRDGEVKRLRQTLCWEVVRGETWQPLNPSISYEVELSYHKKNKTFQYQENGQTYTIDFKEMMVMNASNKESSSRIKRTLLGDCDTAIIHPPPTWTKMNGQDLEIISLKSDSTEYQKIEKEFLKSSKHQDVSPVQVLQINRIQSQSQWHRYCVLKQVVDKKYPNQMNERFLYHGTTKDICQKINKNGFNRSFCGRNAVAHGDGTYFAKEAWYSCQDLYSNPDDKGLKYIYRAKVVTGSLCKSRQGMKEPDSIDPQDPQASLHDCAVDNLQTPFIFVVFCDAGAYPEYLITFKSI